MPPKPKHSKNSQKSSISPNGRPAGKAVRTNEHGIPDWRLEKPDFEIVEISKGPEVHYEIRGKLDAPAPPIRESRNLTKAQCLELYRRMDKALENLYKQGKVVGGVYFLLGQEACSCASAYALRPDVWFAPMIRNQGSQLVRGF